MKKAIIVLSVVFIIGLSTVGLLGYTIYSYFSQPSAEVATEVSDQYIPPKQGLEPIPEGTGFQGRPDNPGNPPEQESPNRKTLNYMRGYDVDLAGDCYYIQTPNDRGYVTKEEWDYIHLLEDVNPEARYILLFTDEYPGTIEQALAEKYGLSAAVEGE